MPPDTVAHNNFGRTNWMGVSLVILGTILALLPVIFRIPAPESVRVGQIFVYIPAIIAVGICYAFDRTSTASDKIGTLLFCLVLALSTTYMHNWLVDRAQFNAGAPNLDWQIQLQKAVIELSPETLPHSYRFLPNSLVRLFEQVTGDFAVARDGYRNLFSVLLFYSFYRLARLYLQHGASLFCVALLALVLPISFRYYAGQFTDPMSHLAFVLACLFIQTEQFVYLLLAVTIGCLTKETIAATAGYYTLFRWRENSFWLKAALLIIAAITICIVARFFVLHGFPHYDQISGVGSAEHIARNWSNWKQWFPGFLYTTIIFVPFVIAGWRDSPWTLRSLALYWLPVLFFSSLFFSWLREARNFVPLTAILIVLTVYQLVPRERAEPEKETVPIDSQTKLPLEPRRKSKRNKGR